MFLKFLYPYAYISGITNQVFDALIHQLYLAAVLNISYFILSNMVDLIFQIISIKLHIIYALTYSIKFLVLISMLIFIRGGVPRYRYDFLTKIGWIKFLSILLSIFLSILLLNYLF